MSAAAILAFREWEEWVSLLAGLWMIISPFLLGFAHTPAMHVNIGIGCAVMFLAGLELRRFLRARLTHADRPLRNHRQARRRQLQRRLRLLHPRALGGAAKPPARLDGR